MKGVERLSHKNERFEVEYRQGVLMSDHDMVNAGLGWVSGLMDSHDFAEVVRLSCSLDERMVNRRALGAVEACRSCANVAAIRV